jgi:hypothetical protein
MLKECLIDCEDDEDIAADNVFEDTYPTYVAVSYTLTSFY